MLWDLALTLTLEITDHPVGTSKTKLVGEVQDGPSGSWTLLCSKQLFGGSVGGS